MGAITYRRSISPATKLLPLVQQFIHDSRFDVIAYSTNQWGFNRTGPGDPFRNQDVVTVGNSNPAATISLRFMSAGKADEWVAMHMPIDDSVLFKIYLNNELLIERDTPGTVFKNYGPKVKQPFQTTPLWNGDPFAYPSFMLQPAKGINLLQFVNLPTSQGNLFFDGFSLNSRGGPLPV